MPNEDGKLKPAVPSQSCLLVPALYHPGFHHPIGKLQYPATRVATQPTFIIFHSNATENLPMSVNSHADLPRADSGLPPDPFLFELATYQFCAPTWWFTPGSKWVRSPQFIQQGKQGQCRYNWGCHQLIDQGVFFSRPATRPTKPTMGSLPQLVGKTYNTSMIRDM